MLPFVSIIIPSFDLSDYLVKETIPALLGQSFSRFEIIVLPDKKTTRQFPKTKIYPVIPRKGPADKRDLGVKKARGEIIAFLDDDSYPDKNWLKNALKIFEKGGGKVAGVCGPQLTPPADNWRRKVSGHVWSSWLGSGGAGVYRCSLSSRRRVDDYPTVNLLVRKKDFLKIGGFDSRFWPGEDTKLCHDLVYKLKKEIIYDPGVLVYHHRREIFGPHLKQISRYALHRGHFARILPKTSFRLGYFFPSLFLLGLIGGFIITLLFSASPAYFSFVPFWGLYLSAVLAYTGLLLATVAKVFKKEKNFHIALALVPAVFLTHLYYGFLFLKGFFDPRLTSRYHR